MQARFAYMGEGKFQKEVLSYWGKNRRIPALLGSLRFGLQQTCPYSGTWGGKGYRRMQQTAQAAGCKTQCLGDAWLLSIPKTPVVSGTIYHLHPTTSLQIFLIVWKIHISTFTTRGLITQKRPMFSISVSHLELRFCFVKFVKTLGGPTFPEWILTLLGQGIHHLSSARTEEPTYGARVTSTTWHPGVLFVVDAR